MSILVHVYMGKIYRIIEHKANNVWDAIRHTIRSLLRIHLELGEHVKRSNTWKIVNRETSIQKNYFATTQKWMPWFEEQILSFILILRNRNQFCNWYKISCDFWVRKHWHNIMIVVYHMHCEPCNCHLGPICVYFTHICNTLI